MRSTNRIRVRFSQDESKRNKKDKEQRVERPRKKKKFFVSNAFALPLHVSLRQRNVNDASEKKKKKKKEETKKSKM